MPTRSQLTSHCVLITASSGVGENRQSKICVQEGLRNPTRSMGKNRREGPQISCLPNRVKINKSPKKLVPKRESELRGKSVLATPRSPAADIKLHWEEN